MLRQITQTLSDNVSGSENGEQYIILLKRIGDKSMSKHEDTAIHLAYNQHGAQNVLM